MFRVTVWGAVVNVVLVGLKLVAGVAGRSSAMVADAVHSLSDLATDVVVIVFVHLSSRPSDESHDYGHGKYETLATAVIGLALLAVGVGIFWSGAVKVAGVLRGEVLPAPEGVALVAAVVSVVGQGFMGPAENPFRAVSRALREVPAGVPTFVDVHAEATSETVHLAELRGDRVVYVDKVEGSRPVRMGSMIGNTSPLHCTGVGKAILAFLPERERRELIEKIELKIFDLKWKTR